MLYFRKTDYLISRDGQVFRFNKKLKPSISQGYYYITICSKDFKKIMRLSRIVAETYIPNPDNLPDVNHIDGNKLNNCVENLEWTTKSNNQNHRVIKLKKGVGISHSSSKLKEEDIFWIRQNYIKGSREFGQRPLSRKYGIHQKTIASIINNKHWRHLL